MLLPLLCRPFLRTGPTSLYAQPVTTVMGSTSTAAAVPLGVHRAHTRGDTVTVMRETADFAEIDARCYLSPSSVSVCSPYCQAVHIVCTHRNTHTRTHARAHTSIFSNTLRCTLRQPVFGVFCAPAPFQQCCEKVDASSCPASMTRWRTDYCGKAFSLCLPCLLSIDVAEKPLVAFVYASTTCAKPNAFPLQW